MKERESEWSKRERGERGGGREGEKQTEAEIETGRD